MNTYFTKPVIAATWLLLITSPLHAWQGAGRLGVPDEAAAEAGGLSQQVQTTREEQGDTGHSLTSGTEGDVPHGNARQVYAAGVMITWSENNDELRGFSISLGEWETLKIERQDKIIPVVASGVAVVRIGDSIAAFSGVKGWWDLIPLSKGSQGQPWVDNDLASIQDNGHLYTFAAAKGRWTSPTDPDLQPVHDQIEIQADPKAVVFAEGPFQKWLESLPKYKARGVRAQFSGSGFVTLYVERRSQLDEVREAFSQALKRHEEVAAAEKSTSLVLDVAEAEKKIADLRRDLQRLELAVHAGSGTTDSPDAKQDDQQRELRGLVEQAFELRQQLQRLDAQRMRLKLQSIEANLNARDKNRENIIRHRVDELLNSRVEAPERDTGEKTTRTANSGTPATRTPIGPTGPPHLPLGGPAGLASHAVPNSDVRIQWPQPAEIVEELRKQKNFVVKYLNELKDSEKNVRTWSEPLAELKSEGTAPSGMSDADRLGFLEFAKGRIPVYQKLVDRHQRDWSRAWSAYQSKLRLLRLDVDEARLALGPLQQNHDRLNALYERGVTPVTEVTKATSDLAIAKIHVQRAEELLKLYADIESSEPDLNPASLDAADSTKPDSSPKSVPDVQDPPLQDAPDNPFAPPGNAVKP